MKNINKIKDTKGSSSNEFTLYSLIDSAGHVTSYSYRCKLRGAKHEHE